MNSQTPNSPPDPSGAVRQRCVYYLSGFDPKGAGHYHALYRDQAKLHAQTTGIPLQVGPRRKLQGGNTAWSVETGQGDAKVCTHFEFMRWDDIVRNHWKKSTPALWRQVISASLFNIRHGTLWAMYKLSWPPAVALAAPFVLLCAVMMGLPVLLTMTAWATLAATGSVWTTALTGVGVTIALMWTARRLEARFSMYWMMRSYHFTARQAQGFTPDLEQRLNEQAQRLADRLAAGADDEVLVVGHSSGAIMAAIVVARALSLRPGALGGGRRLSLLTLGQWLPLLGLVPMAHKFRSELAVLAAEPGLDWVDFSAPPDGCCFALCDPMQACDVASIEQRSLRFKLLNPRFADMFEPDAYQALKKDRLELHFQYLKATPQPVDYNYFRVTAGTQHLWDTYAALPGIVNYTALRPFRVDSEP